MRKILSVCLAMLIVSAAAGFAFADSQQITDKLNSGNYSQNADNLLIIFDRTGSMADQYGFERKLAVEKRLAALFNNTVPDVKLQAGLREIGQYNDVFTNTNLDYGMTAYNRDAVNKLIAKMEDQQYIQLQEDYLTALNKLELYRKEFYRQKELNQNST